MALSDRKQAKVESLNDVKKVSEELTRKRLEGEFTLEDRAKYSNIAAEGVTDGTLVSKAAEVNPAEPGQVNVEQEARSALASVDKSETAKRPTAKK